MKEKNKYAVMLGKIKTPKKAKASRKNGKKGGRPKVYIDCPIHGKTKCVNIPNGVMCKECVILEKNDQRRKTN